MKQKDVMTDLKGHPKGSFHCGYSNGGKGKQR